MEYWTLKKERREYHFEKQDLWGDDDAIDLWVGGEEWTFGKATFDIGDDLWACETLEELGEALTTTRTRQRKAQSRYRPC
ncbi:hypothetical protein RHMOL_Rhmol07G0179300 [Rhododendron molle]|uniref:Uncharacterized protein n=1 Tax=Rhododendron molle TaxID=49168 RepID=A0ACC0N1P2_RHOML|nr:hypothetical protein RHMOL_Rhmol07G0179300 [Rhododendron molle]